MLRTTSSAEFPCRTVRNLMAIQPMESGEAEPLARKNRGSTAALRRRLSGDLDNIVLKALRKEPARRYASVEQLAEDIRRQLQGRPVMATPDSASYRLGKFIRRHKAGVAATVLIALAVTGGVAATLWEARVAVQERARAQRRFNDVRKLANSFLFEFDDAIRDLPGSTPARSLVVMRALEYLDGLAAEARSDRSLQMEIASAYQKVGEVQGDPMFPNLGDSKGALQSFNKALAILETLSKTDPENQQVRMGLASAHQGISDVLDFSGDTTGAVEHSAKALKIYDGLSGNMAGQPKFLVEWVTQTYQYANLLKGVGHLEEAANEYRQAVELSERMIAASPSDPEGKIHLATSLDGLGNLLQETGDTAGALENRRRGLAIREELARLDPNNAHYRRQLAFSHHNVGLSLVEAGEFAAALAQFREELRLFESLSAADPKDVQARRNRSLAHKQIGDVLMRTGDFRGALAQYRDALDVDRDLVAADPGNWQAILDLSFSESKVGSALGKLGQMGEALVILRSAVARQEALIGKDTLHILLHNHVANSYMRLGNCLMDNKDRKAAIEAYRKAIEARLVFAQKSPNSNSNRRALAECYVSLAKALEPSDRQAALKQYGNAVELQEHLIATDQSNSQYRIALADSLSSEARLYVRLAEQGAKPSTRLGYWTKAKSTYQRSQELWRELDGAGKLPPTQVHSVREVSSEIARCDDAMAKLQPVR